MTPEDDVTEPQDVLAEALHKAGAYAEGDDDYDRRRLAAVIRDLLAARGYALVRTPTPPEGLRAALERLLAAAVEMDDGITEHGWAIRDARVALAASPAPDPEGLHDEFAWLIERGQPEKQVPTVWWADRKRWGLAHMDEWTEDANKAYRFASKAEAEDYIERHSPIPSHRPRLGHAVEHGFLASPAPDPGAGLRDAAERVIDAWDHFESKYDLTTSLADLRATLAPSAEPPETET